MGGSSCGCVGLIVHYGDSDDGVGAFFSGMGGDACALGKRVAAVELASEHGRMDVISESGSGCCGTRGEYVGAGVISDEPLALVGQELFV